MTGETSIELARDDGPEFRSVRLTVGDDGAIRMDAQDMGPTVEQVWGDGDYEFWVHVRKEAVGALAFALLREKFSGQRGAVDAFRDFCKTHGIEHEFGNWA
jgi:hypothetical protein